MKDYTETLEVVARAADRAVLEQTLNESLRNDALLAQLEARKTGGGMLRHQSPFVQGVLRYGAAVEAAFDTKAGGADHDYIQKMLDEVINGNTKGPARWAKRWSGKYAERLASLPTVWASPGMVARALALPDDTPLPPRESLPFPDGCTIVLAEPITTDGTTLDGVHVESYTEAVAWWPIADGRVCLTSYGTSDYSAETHLDLVGIGTFGREVASVQEGEQTHPAVNTKDAHDLASLGARLMVLLARRPQDPESKDVRIAVVKAEAKDAKRLCKKRGISREVNVLYLQPEKAQTLGTGGGSTPSRHRVRAHWRWQPYGPGRTLRRWTLVAEHERGTGELDTRERVYAAGRAS